MERLDEEQRRKVSKMSDERLRGKLVQAGYREEDIAALDRPYLLATYAQVLLVEPTEETREGEGEGEVDTEGGEQMMAAAVEVERSLEERRLLLEERKLEEQKKQRYLEERRLEEEREERKKRYEFEQRKWKEEMELKKSEKSYRESMPVKIKSWGDALRNVITKMPNESIEIVSWFISVEKIFDQLKVPDELQSVLIRPYFSERARNLMSKCDPTQSASYQTIKKFLLQEFHLTSSVYLDKFSTLVYDPNETYNQFSTRLKSLFEYYVESRHISHNYDKLVDLIVYDRMKSALPPYLARHVLALEAANKEGWLGRLELAGALDAYMANVQDGRPRVPVPQSRTGLAPADHGKRIPEVAKPFTGKTEQVNTQKPVPLPRSGVGRRCYICSSPSHISTTCPQRIVKPANNGFYKPSPKTQVNLCAVNSKGPVVSQQVQDKTNPEAPEVNHVGLREMYENDVRNDESVTLALMENKVTVNVDEGPHDPLLAEGWSQLRYVDVLIEGLPEQVTALNDSGCQLCVIRADVAKNLDLPKLGEAKLRGLSSDIVPADIVRLRMKLTGGTEFCNVTCAVVENLNYCLILGSDVVDKLNVMMSESDRDYDEVENVDVVDVTDVSNHDDAHNENDINADVVYEGDNISGVSGDDCDYENGEIKYDPKKASADELKVNNEQLSH